MFNHSKLHRHVAVVGAVTAAAVATTVMTAGGPVSAGHNVGVKYVHLDSEPIDCFEDQGYPCPEGIPVGATNTIVVSQSPTLDDEGELQWEFDSVSGTVPGDPESMRIGFRLEAGCRSTYSFHSVSIIPGGSTYEGLWHPTESVGHWHGAGVDVNHDAKTLSQRHIEVVAPVDDMLSYYMNDTFEATFDGQPGFDPIAWGEYLVQLDVEAGMDESEARSLERSVTLNIDFHSEVVCRGGLFDLMYREMNNPAIVPIVVVWQPAPVQVEPPAGPRRKPVHEKPGASDDVTIAPFVDQATLVAIPDADDPCVLHLSGALTSTGETDVSYRFVNELGVHSQTFHITIDQTQTSFVDHEVQLEPVGPGDGELDLAAVDEGGIGGYAAEDGDNHQGYYRLEVTSPNQITSDVASYNVASCVTPANSQLRALP